MRFRDVTVLTSDGRIAKFDQNYIIKQIKRDANAANIQISDDEINNLLSKIKTQLRKLDIDQLTGSIIRGVVNDILIKNNYTNIFRMSQTVGMPTSDYLEIVSGNSIKDNANTDMLIPEAQHFQIASILAKQAALNILPSELSQLHINGDIHIHDLDRFGECSFCRTWDLRYFFYYGLYVDGTGKTIPAAGPAKNATVAILHAAKALGAGGAHFAGGQELNYFNVFIAPYLYNLSYDEIYQLMQMFVYEMSQMMIRGQPVFSSIQIMPGCPNIWKDRPAVYKGKISDETYGKFEREIRLSFKALCELYKNGDIFGRPFSFPKLDIVVLPEHIDNNENVIEQCGIINDNKVYIYTIPSYNDLWLNAFELAAKNGTPYFENQLHNNPNEVVCYNCCAFKLGMSADSKEMDKILNFENGAHFDTLGSHQVVSINLPRLAYKALQFEKIQYKDFGESLSRIENIDINIKYLIDDIIKIFKIKYDIVKNRSLPFARQTPIDPNNPDKRAPPLYIDEDTPMCIAFVGLNEAVQILTGKEIHESEDSWLLGLNILTDIKTYLVEVQTDLEFPLAFARAPAETTAGRFARLDVFDPDEQIRELARKVVKGDLQKALENPDDSDQPIYYTNGGMISDDATINIFEKIKLEDPVFAIVDGGNMSHFWLGEGETNPSGLMDFAMKLFKNSNIDYCAFTKDFSICNNCKKSHLGLIEKCSKCGSDKLTQYTRVTGYLQAIDNFGESKKEEVKHRKHHIIG